MNKFEVAAYEKAARYIYSRASLQSGSPEMAEGDAFCASLGLEVYKWPIPERIAAAFNALTLIDEIAEAGPLTQASDIQAWIVNAQDILTHKEDVGTS